MNVGEGLGGGGRHVHGLYDLAGFDEILAQSNERIKEKIRATREIKKTLQLHN